MEAAVKKFFSCPKFAVAGASQNSSKFGYKVLAWYHIHGLPVTPINPTSAEISLPSKTYQTATSAATLQNPGQTALSIITPPAVTRRILEEAKNAGISAVWLQPGTFDNQGIKYAQDNFEAAVGGQGGAGGEGWCVLMDGESTLQSIGREWKSRKL